ncbi:cytochrome c550 [Aquibacillus salsiterrae]|uniref:Cytochrome c n=1 Tax=Aquibacillus salsiterrae TaxID=2950439 RepID=A0A9X3WCP3_9BACI|nr:cytochrome c [Aquibacillus salsiterrae]MDC3415545.1 cytochrome c [Aquibacillus salsiterrae]
MKRNPVIPYAIIAVLGILAMIILSVVGVNQQEKIELAQENGGQAEGGELKEPDAIAQACISCHGSDLSGGVGPSLQQVGNKYSEEEILEILKNGIEGTAMPQMAPGTISNEEAQVLAGWLAEKK